MSFWLPVYTLLRRELIRFWREKARVLGFVGSPLVFWLVIGSGFGNLRFFFPGTLTLTVMFSAVFSTMTLIEDRREGFLLSMLVSPAPRTAMVLGKVLGSSTLAWIQGLILLAFTPLTGLRPSAPDLLKLVAVLFLISFTFTALGFLIAWQMDSTQGFHAVMNLVLFPLWMVSGSIFPMSSAHGWIRVLMRVNPLTYSTAALRRLLEPNADAPALAPSLLITVLCGVVLLAASTVSANRKSARVFLILVAVVLASCAPAPKPLASYGAVPAFRLTAQTGEEFDSARQLGGKIWVADFIFTNCTGPCPRMSSQMRRVQSGVEAFDDVKLVSFTVDPARDTPPVLAEYARRFQAGPGRWYFLTGPPETLHLLNREAFKLGNVDGSLDHSTRFVLIDRKSRIRGYYLTSEPDAIDRLFADLRRLRKEPS